MQRHFCFPAGSGTSSPLFLPALLLLGQWGGLLYPNLSQFVNLPPRGQPHLQQQSLGKGSASLRTGFNFSSLPPGELGRAGTAERGQLHRHIQRESAGADPCSHCCPEVRRSFEDAPTPATMAFHSLPSTARPSQSSLELMESLAKPRCFFLCLVLCSGSWFHECWTLRKNMLGYFYQEPFTGVVLLRIPAQPDSAWVSQVLLHPKIPWVPRWKPPACTVQWHR